MNWEILFSCGLVIFGLGSFIWEKIPTDVTAMVLFGVILLVSEMSGSVNLPDIGELLSVFSNPAPLTIVAMFIISAALEKCGAIDMLSRALGCFRSWGYRGLLGVVILLVALASAFVNNTAVVVVLLPVVLSLVKKIGTPASKFLIPLSYASIFGGCCTAIGTSTNILVSSVLEAEGLAPLSMFELSFIGVPLLVLGVLYLVIFGDKLLPVRESLTSILSEEERKEYIIEAYINSGSNLIGKSLKELNFLSSEGIRVLELIRNSIVVESDFSELLLEEGDRFVLACHPSAIVKARNIEGVNFRDQMALGLEKISSNEGLIVEGIVGPKSSLIGKTVREVNFRQHFRAVLMAVHRKGSNLRAQLGMLRFEFGDTLLLLGTEGAIENLRRSDDIILLDRPAIPAEDMRRKMPIAVGVLLGVILFAAFDLMPIVVAGIIGVVVVFLTRCLKPKDGYHAVEWRILVLIYGMLALGMCMERSGFTDFLAGNLVNFSGHYFSEWMRPYVLLVGIYICTGVLTEILSNNATAVLMAPIAIGLGMTLGVDPRPFVIAVTIGASASFSTPIGYQTNTYVYGVGGYKFSDFWKVGLPLNFIYFMGSMVIIPIFWPF